jgi:hypothetical protein
VGSGRGLNKGGILAAVKQMTRRRRKWRTPVVTTYKDKLMDAIIILRAAVRAHTDFQRARNQCSIL